MSQRVQRNKVKGSRLRVSGGAAGANAKHHDCCTSLIYLVRMLLLLAVLLTAPAAFAASTENGDYDGRTIASLELVFEGSPLDEAVQAELLAQLKIGPNSEYSAVRVRDSLQALFDSG